VDTVSGLIQTDQRVPLSAGGGALKRYWAGPVSQFKPFRPISFPARWPFYLNSINSFSLKINTGLSYKLNSSNSTNSNLANQNVLESL
jgi:hypothetical protein